ncbi:DUF7427 family protein [Nocardia wallacei]|uniref:DUF7427 family protein n=1 Tax=Nocardia wallacei TaxID=480035 RepID=UPI003CC7EE22
MMRARVKGWHAWLTLAAAITIYDLAVAQADELLTDTAHRMRQRHPIIWPLIVTLTAAHLIDGYRTIGIPNADPYAIAARCTQHLKR